MYMLMSSGPFTLNKLSAHSVATALASSVLPVPARVYFQNRLKGVSHRNTREQSAQGIPSYHRLSQCRALLQRDRQVDPC